MNLDCQASTRAASAVRAIEKVRVNNFTAWLALSDAAKEAGPEAPVTDDEYYSTSYEYYSDEGGHGEGGSSGVWRPPPPLTEPKIKMLGKRMSKSLLSRQK